MNINRNFKGVWIPKEVWLNKDLTIMQKLFLVEIDSLDNDKGCFASNKYFSEFFGISKGRCTQIIKELESKNLVEISLIYDGKVIKKRVVKILNTVVNKLNLGSENIKQGYLENAEDNNTLLNNTVSNTNIDDKPKNQKNDFKTLVLNFNDDIKNCYQNCKNEFPEHLQPKTNKILFNWLSVIDKLNRIDKLPFSEIERIVKGIRNDSFWSKQFLSLTKLRKNDKNNVKYIVVFNEYLKYNKKEKKITGAESFKNAILKQLQDEQYTDI